MTENTAGPYHLHTDRANKTMLLGFVAAGVKL